MSKPLYELDVKAWHDSLYGKAHPHVKVYQGMRFRYLRGNSVSGVPPADYVWRMDVVSDDDARIYLEHVPTRLFVKVE